MEHRIAALEQNVAALGKALEDCNVRRIALLRAVVATCGPLLATAGLSPEQVKLAGETMSSEVIFTTLDSVGAANSDRITGLMSAELDLIMSGLAREVAAVSKVPRPAPRNRFALDGYRDLGLRMQSCRCTAAEARRRHRERSRRGSHCRMRELPEPLRAQCGLRNRAGDQSGTSADLALCKDEAGRP